MSECWSVTIFVQRDGDDAEADMDIDGLSNFVWGFPDQPRCDLGLARSRSFLASLARVWSLSQS